MKWHSVKDKLPRTEHHVLVCRVLRIECLDDPILVHDIGVLHGTNLFDRWSLDSQQYCILPLEPTLNSGIVTHWAELPKLPTD